MQMRSSAPAACTYPPAALEQMTNGNMCSFYFYEAGRAGTGLSLWGFKSLFSGDVLLSRMTVMLGGSSMAVALTCLDAPSLRGPGAGQWPCCPARRETQACDRALWTVAEAPACPSRWASPGVILCQRDPTSVGPQGVTARNVSIVANHRDRHFGR